LANFTSGCLDACDDAVTVTGTVKAPPVEEAGPSATVVSALVEQPAHLFVEKA
jgi:hypothetical protein